MAQAKRKRKTHCLRGHPYNKANTRWYIDAAGRKQRACRECARLYNREQYQRKNTLASFYEEKEETMPVKMYKDLTPEEQERYDQVRAAAGSYRSHYECVVAYLNVCRTMVELGMKKPGYRPSVHLVQKETGIPCWRTVDRAMQKAQAEKGL